MSVKSIEVSEKRTGLALDIVKEKLDMWRQFKDAKFDGNSVTFTNNNSSMIYLCLPENEDPRKQTKPTKPQK